MNMDRQPPGKLTYLLVDDDPADLELLRTAFSTVDPEANVVTESNSARVVEWLDASLVDGERSNVVLITDLNMPAPRGDDLVRSIRQRWTSGPVSIVLSTSDRKVDVIKAYEAGANSYHAKPMGYHSTVELCRSISDYWGVADKPPIARR